MITVGCNMFIIMIYTWKYSTYEIRLIPRRIGQLLRKNDLQAYYNISIPSVIMLMAEWIGVEILIIIAASISVSAVGAMSLSYSFHNVIYQFPYGF